MSVGVGRCLAAVLAVDLYGEIVYAIHFQIKTGEGYELEIH